MFKCNEEKPFFAETMVRAITEYFFFFLVVVDSKSKMNIKLVGVCLK